METVENGGFNNRHFDHGDEGMQRCEIVQG
jgi:hypothetical protein